MTIQTSRLLIRDLSVSDLDNIHHLHSLPETDRFNTLGIPETILETQELLTEWLSHQNQDPRNSYIFSIELPGSREFLGLIALIRGKEKYRIAETWYKILPGHWGRGYATEALSGLLDFGFKKLKLHRIEAGCAVDNTASAQVLEKVGMVKEGRKRKKLPIRGEWQDNFFYAILEEDFV